MHTHCPECRTTYQCDSELPCCQTCMDKKKKAPAWSIVLEFKCHDCSYYEYDAREYLANIMITGAPLCPNCDKAMEMLEFVLV